MYIKSFIILKPNINLQFQYIKFISEAAAEEKGRTQNKKKKGGRRRIKE
jgi:hypothetical protein